MGPGLTRQALATLLAALGAGWLVLALDGRGPGALGFYAAPSAGPELLGGIALGSAVALGSVALIAVAGGLRWSTEPAGLGEWVTAAGASLAVLALPAAAEEAMLRGYPLQALAERFGNAWALVVTSVVFGVMHLGNPNVTWVAMANLVLAGLFLGVVYLKTASLWWATGAHLGWNWAHGFLADLPVSGLELVDAPGLAVTALGPEWLSGGPFGMEGSVVTLGVVTMVTVAAWRLDWLAPSRAARRSGCLIPLPEGSSKVSLDEHPAPGDRIGSASQDARDMESRTAE